MSAALVAGNKALLFGGVYDEVCFGVSVMRFVCFFFGASAMMFVCCLGVSVMRFVCRLVLSAYLSTHTKPQYVLRKTFKNAPSIWKYGKSFGIPDSEFQ